MLPWSKGLQFLFFFVFCFCFWTMVKWNSRVTSKVSFFAWKLAGGKILILDMLQRRGCILVNRCFLFKLMKN